MVDASQGSTPPPPPQQGTVTIPDDLKKKFPELIGLISGSESMNNEERQYWVNILPVMTQEQQANLREILVNERDQLQAIDAKYTKEVQQIGQEQFIRTVEAQRLKQRSQRQQAEQTTLQAEERHAEDVLKQIEQT